ncbi:PIN domain-containing protein [Polaromonas sp.]|uniref:PIN domain-containing protein n=1 Tax=Polaromonas sp. TaxID=1869339 RepID=UPI003BACB700
MVSISTAKQVSSFSKMASKIFIFPDTNLFLQCKPLTDVDWTLLGEYDHIDVVITRPVQVELDSSKAKGNSRVASRSRSAASLIAQLLDGPEDGLVIKQVPVVRLKMMYSLRPDAVAAEELKLNYEANDDKLVGTALAFQQRNPEELACLLTNDLGPMFSAKAVGLAYKKVPEQWLLDREPDEAERRENELKAQLAQYQKSEPKFELKLLEVEGSSIQCSAETYVALLDAQRDLILARLQARFPEAYDFGPSLPMERVVNKGGIGEALFGVEKEIFTPATEAQIEQYREDYAGWKAECDEYLRSLHDKLNVAVEWPTLRVRITNSGSRPADDALVVLEVEGNFRLVRPPYQRDKDDDANKPAEESPKLPSPPPVPKGKTRRERRRSLFGSLDPDALLPQFQRSFSPIGPLPFIPRPRDLNTFYWGDCSLDVPYKSLSLSCKQWRHAQSAEDFSALLHFPRQPGNYSGRLKVTVHAANLTAPAVLTIPVRVSVEERSPMDSAQRLVDAL